MSDGPERPPAHSGALDGSVRGVRPSDDSVREVRAYLSKLLLAIAVAVVIMSAAALTAWSLYGPTGPEVVRPAPVAPREGAMPVLPSYR